MNKTQYRLLKEAAICGTLKDMPRESLSLELLMGKKKYDDTIFHIAAKNRTLDQIPKEFLTEESLYSQNIDGDTPIHIAAGIIGYDIEGDISGVPKEFINKKLLTIRNFDGNSILHCAAMGGCLNQIPKELFTKESLSLKNNFEDTPIHCSARGGSLEVLKDYLKDHDLLSTNADRQNVIHLAAIGQCLEVIPKEYKTKENLLEEDKDMLSPLDYLAQWSHMDEPLAYLTKAMKSLNKETLLAWDKETKRKVPIFKNQSSLFIENLNNTRKLIKNELVKYKIIDEIKDSQAIEI